MALKRYWTGSAGPYLYEEADFWGFRTDTQIFVENTPTLPEHVLRLEDLGPLGVPVTRTLEIDGTANQIVVSPSGAQDLSTNRVWTISFAPNAIVSIARLTNLSTNGFVKTINGDGTLTVDSTSSFPPTSRTLTINGTNNQVSVSPSGAQDLSADRSWTISLAGPYTPATFTAHGVLVGEGTSSITALTVGTNGQLLIGSTGADPVFASLSTGTGISATPGAGTLTITNTGVTSLSSPGFTLSLSASTGTINIDLNLSHSNTWLVSQAVQSTGTIFEAISTATGEVLTSDASTSTLITQNIRPNSGKDGWLSFTENSVADRWILGIKHTDSTLYLLQGAVGGGVNRFKFSTTPTLAIADTSDTTYFGTLGFTSSVTLTADRALTIDMENVAHTLKLGTTAGTITFPNTAADTVAMLGIANVFTVAQEIEPSIAANTSADGLILDDPTAATSGNQQYSPRMRLTSHGWRTDSGGASEAIDFIEENIPVQGTAHPSGRLQWSSQVAGGGYTAQMQLVSSSGALLVGTTTDDLNVPGVCAVNPSGAGPVGLFVINDSTTGVGSGACFSVRNTAAAVNTQALVTMQTVDDAAAVVAGTRFSAKFTSVTSGAVSADFLFQTRSAGTMAERMRIVADGGVTLVGTTSKGAGTLNVSTDIYKNGTAYTNPDAVFEHWATGQVERFRNEWSAHYTGLQPLAQVRDFVRTAYVLPHIHAARLRSHDGTIGLFGGGDAFLASLEEAYLYIFQLHDRLERLEARAK